MKNYELLREDDDEFPLCFISYLAIERMSTRVRVVLEVGDIEIDRALLSITHPVNDQLEPTITELKRRLREALPHQIEKLERALKQLREVQNDHISR